MTNIQVLSTRRFRQRLLTLFILLSILLLALYFWWQGSLAAVNPLIEQRQEFVINKGESVRDISRRLKKQNLIRDPIVFFLLVRQLELASQIEAGNYFLSPAMSAAEIAQELTHGTTDVWLTIIEGWRREEVAQQLNYTLQIPNSKFMEATNNLEGYLFPDTYRFPQVATVDVLVKTMTDNFRQKFNDLKQQIGNQSDLSDGEVVILASLVEREAKLASDRPQVAGILLNRLRDGMALQVDASVQYALASSRCRLAEDKCRWWPKVAPNDLQIESPYNTYLNPGLPAGPIANPGLASLKAVLNPTMTDYWYYLSDRQGQMHYAKTLEEHNDNIATYLSP